MSNGREKLDQIVRGLDGVTAGPWLTQDERDGTYPVWTRQPHIGTLATVHDEDINGDFPAKLNAAHFARCSPDAIREIAAYVSETEARATAAEATVTALQEALEQIADLTARCEHDGGFDREIGPIGCNLGDKCLCIGIHPIALTALSSIRRTA